MCLLTVTTEELMDDPTLQTRLLDAGDVMEDAKKVARTISNYSFGAGIWLDDNGNDDAVDDAVKIFQDIHELGLELVDILKALNIVITRGIKEIEILKNGSS